MVIGSVLLQPQRLERASTRDADGALMDDLMRLALCLAKDAAGGGPCVQKMEAAAELTLEAIVNAKLSDLEAATARFGDLFDPLRGRLATFAANGFDDTGDFVEILADLLVAVIGTAENLTPNGIRQSVSHVFAVVTDDLGLTPTFVEESVWALFDGAILALNQAPAEETPAQMANRREIARLLGRIKRDLTALFTMPAFNADLAADALLTLMHHIGLDEVLTQVGCTGAALAAYFRAGSSVLNLVEYQAFPPFGPGGMGAATAPTPREQYCWYATWLLEYQNVNGDLGSMPASIADELFDGYVSPALRDAFRPLSVVLSRGANLLTITENSEWKVIDRKKYVIHKMTSTGVGVYRLFQMSDGDFLEAVDDLEKLKKAFRDNGILLSDPPTVVSDGSNVWTLQTPAQTYRAVKEGGTVTIRPTTISGALFDLGAGVIPDLDAGKISDDLRLWFRMADVPITPKASLSQREPGEQWLIDDGELVYKIEKAGSAYKVSMGNALGWINEQLGWPDGDKVWVDKEATMVMLGQRILHVGTDVSWDDAPVFKDGALCYTFKLADADLMEHFAYHSAWSQDALKALAHLISIEKGDIASNVVNAAWYLYEMIMKLALHRPSSDVLGFWLDWLIPLLATIIASLEGMQTKVSFLNWFIFWFCILLGTDLGEKALYSHYASMARGLFISSVTLLNQDTSATGMRPLNHKHIEPFVSGFVDLSLFVFAKAIPKIDYTYPTETAVMTGGYWIGGGLGMGLLGGLLGATAAAGLSRGTFTGGNYLKASLKGLLWGLVRFWPMVFLVKEGDTSGGTYNPNGASYPGYPAGGASSPYNMPYPAGTDILWGQGNQGMFSHHNYTSNLPQVYAFDLAMDQGDPVLAMRPGTVVDYFDWIPDDIDPDATQQAAAQAAALASGFLVAGQTSGPSWNFVAIRHDRDESGALLASPINATYDRDQGATTTVTYAYYGHGRQNSVRSVFAARGIAPNNIVGQPVLRGQRIMLAGDTGRSFHNHLHIHVRPGPPVGQFSTDTGPAPKMGTANRTIPFTFREVDDVPTMLNTYTSQNVEVP